MGVYGAMLCQDAPAALRELAALEYTWHAYKDHARATGPLGYLVLDSASVCVVRGEPWGDEVLASRHGVVPFTPFRRCLEVVDEALALEALGRPVGVL